MGPLTTWTQNVGTVWAWSVEEWTAVLATGIYTKGGAHSYGIPGVEVSIGDFLYFIVDRKQDYLCDNTAFNVNIRPMLILTTD